jgi:hypothetical protein
MTRSRAISVSLPNAIALIASVVFLPFCTDRQPVPRFDSSRSSDWKNDHCMSRDGLAVRDKTMADFRTDTHFDELMRLDQSRRDGASLEHEIVDFEKRYETSGDSQLKVPDSTTKKKDANSDVTVGDLGSYDNTKTTQDASSGPLDAGTVGDSGSNNEAINPCSTPGNWTCYGFTSKNKSGDSCDMYCGSDVMNCERVNSFNFSCNCSHNHFWVGNPKGPGWNYYNCQTCYEFLKYYPQCMP